MYRLRPNGKSFAQSLWALVLVVGWTAAIAGAETPTTSTPATPLSPRSDPCAPDTESGPTTSELRACSESRQRQAETDLKLLLDTLRARMADAAVRADERERVAVQRKLLEDAQARWLEYVGSQCEAAYQEIFPGTFAPVYRADCRERLTRERIVELRRTYMPEN